VRISINQKMVADIDALTRRHAIATSTKGELKQLSTLFGPTYLKALRHLLQRSFVQTRGARYDVTIRLAWIDKIPLADIASEPERTELGDAVLFAFDELVLPNGKGPGITRARATLLQAKVTQTLNQITKPTVPISPMKGSTKKEFDLLSKWPRFDLFKASNSDVALAQDVDLRGKKAGTLPFGWYVAAPRLKSSAKKADTSHWKSWWMAGPPILGQACDVTFGGLLQAFFAETPLPHAGNLEVGATFCCKSYPPAPDLLEDWDRVCAEIIALVESSKAPQSLFGNDPPSRMSAMESIGFPAQSGALSNGISSSLAFSIGPKAHPAQIPRRESRGRQFLRRILNILVRRRRIPVVIVHTKLIEGF